MTNPPPVAPVVTDEILGMALDVYNKTNCAEDKTQDDAMRAAITAALEVSGELERLRAERANLIAACDAALNWADANARWFDISTAPTKNGVGFHAINYDREGLLAYHVIRHEDEYFFVDLDPCDIREFSHWRPLPPPPSNPPLPEPLERLGEVLRRIKGVG